MGVSLLGSSAAFAVNCSAISAASTNISSDCTTFVYSGTGYPTGTLSIDSGVTVSNNGNLNAFTLGATPTLTQFGSITNNGTIRSNASFADMIVVQDNASLGTLTNNGLISQTGNFSAAIGIYGTGAINNLINNGTIQVTTAAPAIYYQGTIGTFTNAGSVVSGGLYSIQSAGGSPSINTLNNLQGVGNSNGALTANGKLPTNYNIIIRDFSNYGQLKMSSTSGSTTFGVYGGGVTGVAASVIDPNGKYAGVIQGVTAANLRNTTLTYNGVTGTLALASGSTSVWDLCFGQCNVTTNTNSNTNSNTSPSAPTAADTQSSLSLSASALRAVFNQQTAVVNNSLNYDCTVFAEHDVCISGGGRFATANSSITGEQVSTLLVGAYKAMKDTRIGAFIDQNAATPNVNGISISKAPLYGVFGVWNQNPDLSGYEVRLSSSWSQQNITQTRDVVGTSEAGTGSATLKTLAMSGVVSYAMPIEDTRWVAAPYAGLRKTKVSRDSYTENSTATTPLTYSLLNQEISTALAGVRFSKQYGNDLFVTATLGVERNVGSTISDLNASGVSGLTGADFSADYAKNRPVASIGSSYAISKDQRISLTALYRKEAFQSTASTTALLMYQVGL